MKVKISFWFREQGADKKWRRSFEEDMACTGDDKQDYRNALAYLLNKVITGEINLGEETPIQEIGIRALYWYGPEDQGDIPLKNIPELEKITKDISVLIEKRIIDLGSDTRFWGKTRDGDYRLSIIRSDRSALILYSNEVYFPDPEKIVLVEKVKSFSFIIKPSPERAIKMATKKATPAAVAATPAKQSKAAKQAAMAPVPAATPAKGKGTKAVADKPVKEVAEKAPTKKSIVATHLKEGLKPAEIVEIMGKNGITTTLASVRAFIASINAGE